MPHRDLFDVKRASKWDVGAVGHWLESIGYHECAKYFAEHKINGLALLMLDEEDLKEVRYHF